MYKKCEKLLIYWTNIAQSARTMLNSMDNHIYMSHPNHPNLWLATLPNWVML